MNFESYNTDGFYDEFFDENNKPRIGGPDLLIEKLQKLSTPDLLRRRNAAEIALLHMGITFNVYGDKAGTDKIFPFDVIPRIIFHHEWEIIEKGLKQRIYALNKFIDDIYHDQKILKDKIIPEDIILSSKNLRKACYGLNPPHGIWCHITGTDLVRDKDGQFYVLEDNLRCPSGASYMLGNRQVMKKTFPIIFNDFNIKAIDDYSERLFSMLDYMAMQAENRRVVVLTPGNCNSAYFEHSFLAQQMGVELVEGNDLTVNNNKVYMRTTKGFQQVDVIYRRIDDDFIDPQVFRPDSLLGVPGLMNAYRSGNVALANAPGTGIADDKVIYAFVPAIIKYYLGEEPYLPNVDTYLCCKDSERSYALENMEKLVIKAADESGGYGMLIGPYSTKAEREEFARRIKADPRKYIAQPTLSLSLAPVIDNDCFEGRHIDLRPYIIYGEDIYVTPGGLTRVAMKKGSLVVNSSQGGGSKDTWVIYKNGNGK